MVTVDFFHLDRAVTLRQPYILFALEAGNRHLHVLGVTPHPDAPWTTQQTRNHIIDLGEHTAQSRFLVHDRAEQSTASFDAMLADTRTEIVEIPPRCPRTNCYAQRFVSTARTELTHRMPILGKQHLRRVLAKYSAHYNTHRPHQALQLHPPPPESPTSESEHDRIQRRPDLGDLTNEYRTAA